MMRNVSSRLRFAALFVVFASAVVFSFAKFGNVSNAENKGLVPRVATQSTGAPALMEPSITGAPSNLAPVASGDHVWTQIASLWSTGFGFLSPDHASSLGGDDDTPFVILYDQMNNPAPTPGGVTSQDFETANDPFDSFAADDFVVPAGQTWNVTQVNVGGEYSVGGGPAASFNVFFYQDAATLPGTTVATRLANTFTNGPNAMITLTTPVTLTPGTYWVSVQARQDLTPAGQFFWDNRLTISNSGAAWQNPGGGFAACPSWGRKTTCLPTQNGPDQLFQIVGTTGAGGTPTPSPTPCVTYTQTTSTGATVDPGTTLVPGSNCDDCSSAITLPFPFTFYGSPFTTVNAISNGNLQFSSTDATFTNTCLPYTAANNVIAPHWDDFLLTGAGQGVFTSTSGVAPNRIFNINWIGAYFSGGGTVNLEARLFETSGQIEFIYGTVTQGGSSATVGLQKGTGSVLNQFECNTAGTLSPGLKITYVPGGCVTPSPSPSASPTPTPTPSPSPSPTCAPTSGSISTLISNNGSGGIFLQLTPTSSALQVTSFDTQFSGAAGLAGSVEVWTRPGPYAGFTSSSTGWTLTQTVSITSAGTATNAPVVLTTPLNVPVGTTSVYLQGITVGNGIRYQGTGTTATTTFTNSDLTLFSDVARVATVAFTGTQFSPRAFSGNVNYTIGGGCPTPTPSVSPSASPTPTPTPSPSPTCAPTAWSPGTPYPITISRYGFAQTGTHFYVFGGVSNGTRQTVVNRMDIATGVWQPRAALPWATEAPACALMAATGIVYCAEGDTGNGFASYNIATDTWTPLAAVPGNPHYGSAAGAFNGKVFVAGGTAAFTNAVQVFDVATNTWSAGTAAPNDFLLAGYQQVGQFLYVVGGFNSAGPIPGEGMGQFTSVLYNGEVPHVPDANNTSTLRLDLTSAPGVWTSGPAFTPNRADFGLAFDAGTNKLYALGGDATGGGFFDSTNLVNELSVASWPAGTWTASAPNLPAPNRQANQAGFFGGGQIWSVGGLDGATFAFLAEVQHRSNGACGPTPTPSPSVSPTPSPSASPTCAPASFRVLIVYADSSGVPAALQAQVLAEPGVTAADLFDGAAGTPTLAQLQAYNIVVPMSNSTFLNDTTLGNNLADYVDGGGVVVQYGFSHYGPAQAYGVNGRWITGNYNPYIYSTNLVGSTPYTLGTFNAGHPLMAGVTVLSSDFQNVVTPVGGTTQVAAASNNNSLVAFRPVSGGHTTVGVTAYVGIVAVQSGHWGRVIVNAGRWLLPAGYATPSPSASPTPTPTPTPSVSPSPSPSPGCTPAWQNEPAMTTARRNPAAVAVGSNLYAISGFTAAPDYTNVNEAFNGTSWTTLAPIPVPHAQSRGAAVGTNIYVPGGFNSIAFTGPIDNMQIYNTTANTWSAGAVLPGTRGGPATAAFNGLVYVIGGYTTPFPTVTTTVYIYNPGSNTYTTGAAMPVGQGNVTGVLFNGEIYVVGGGTSPGAQYAYNPVTNAWRTIAPMPTTGGMCQSDGGFVLNGEVWIVGCLGLAINQQVWIYNPGSNAWRAGPLFNVDHQGPGSTLFNGRGFVVGGGSVAGGSTAVESVGPCGPVPTPTPSPSPSVSASPSPSPSGSPSPSPTPCSVTYTRTTGTGATIVPATTMVPGSNCDDCSNAVALPFPFSFYGTPFTTVNAISNGNLQFSSTDTTFTNTCLPYAAGNNVIAPHWDDFNFAATGGIFTSTSGSAPNRIFNIEWTGPYFSGGGTADFEVRLYEGTNQIDFIYGTVTQGGSSGTIGIQKTNGSGGTFDQFACNTAGSVTSGLRVTYVPSAGACGTPSPSPSASPTPTPSVSPSPTPTPLCTPGPAGPWTAKANYPFTTYGTAVATEGTFAYAFGGNTIGGAQHAESNRYNAVTNAWTSLAPMTAGADYLGHADFGGNGKIYVIGGLTNGTFNRIYDIALNTWTSGAAVPVAVYDQGHAYSAGKVYVIGGIVGGVASNGVYAYDVAANTWTTRANLPVAEFDMACGVIGSRIYCAGGSTGTGQIADLYIYDIAANTWSAGPPMSVAANYPAGTVVNGKLWVIGGGNPFNAPDSPESSESFNNTQIYDPVANSWSAGPTLLQARSFADAVTLNVTGGEMALIVGGYNSTLATSIDTVEGSVTTTCPGTPTPSPSASPTPSPSPSVSPTPTPSPSPSPSVTSVQFSSPTYLDDESNTAVITVTRTGALTGTSTVQYATSDGTAMGGASCTTNVDYITAAGTLTFNPTVASQTFNVSLCADTITEADQTVNLALSNVTGGVLGSPNTAVLTINDTATQFENQTGIVINGGAAAAPYPSNITVTGAPPVIGGMRVTVYDYATTIPVNVGFLLVSPGGTKFILMANAGGLSPMGTSATLNFTDAAGQVIPANTAPVTADYEPTSYGTVAAFPPPAPGLPYNLPGSTIGGTGTQTLGGNFNGTNANGTWSLYVREQAPPPFSPNVVVGNLANGWGLEFFSATAAQASISGRVLTAEGMPIRNARVVVTGNTLSEPRTVSTGSFGYFSIDGLTVGETYVVTVNSQRYTFAVPSRVITLVDNIFDADFIADPGNR